eukprot:3708008-Heterocapsa_arctica.AAC.1
MRWEPDGRISRGLPRGSMRALPSDSPGKAGAGKSEAPLADSFAFCPEAPGRQPGKPNWQEQEPRPGNAPSAEPKDEVSKKPPFTDGGTAQGGNC